jgi:hypothetical protein
VSEKSECFDNCNCFVSKSCKLWSQMLVYSEKNTLNPFEAESLRFIPIYLWIHHEKLINRVEVSPHLSDTLCGTWVQVHAHLVPDSIPKKYKCLQN